MHSGRRHKKDQEETRKIQENHMHLDIYLACFPVKMQKWNHCPFPILPLPPTVRAPPAPGWGSVSLSVSPREWRSNPDRFPWAAARRPEFGGMEIRDVARLSSNTGHLPEVLPCQEVPFPGSSLPSKDCSCQILVSYEQRWCWLINWPLSSHFELRVVSKFER